MVAQRGCQWLVQQGSLSMHDSVLTHQPLYGNGKAYIEHYARRKAPVTGSVVSCSGKSGIKEVKAVNGEAEPLANG